MLRFKSSETQPGSNNEDIDLSDKLPLLYFSAFGWLDFWTIAKLLLPGVVEQATLPHYP